MSRRAAQAVPGGDNFSDRTPSLRPGEWPRPGPAAVPAGRANVTKIMIIRRPGRPGRAPESETQW